jgi:NADH:ubiquinone oxidoreductase subunit 4 (subunit M)
MDEQRNQSKIKTGEDRSIYRIDSDYLPSVFKHIKEVELIRARRAILENLVIISPLILIIIVCGVVINNNLDIQNNYEKNTSEQVR